MGPFEQLLQPFVQFTQGVWHVFQFLIIAGIAGGSVFIIAFFTFWYKLLTHPNFGGILLLLYRFCIAIVAAGLLIAFTVGGVTIPVDLAVIIGALIAWDWPNGQKLKLTRAANTRSTKSSARSTR